MLGDSRSHRDGLDGVGHDQVSASEGGKKHTRNTQQIKNGAGGVSRSSLETVEHMRSISTLPPASVELPPALRPAVRVRAPPASGDDLG